MELMRLRLRHSQCRARSRLTSSSATSDKRASATARRSFRGLFRAGVRRPQALSGGIRTWTAHDAPIRYLSRKASRDDVGGVFQEVGERL